MYISLLIKMSEIYHWIELGLLCNVIVVYISLVYLLCALQIRREFVPVLCPTARHILENHHAIRFVFVFHWISVAQLHV